MKKQELKQLIRESITELINEQNLKEMDSHDLLGILRDHIADDAIDFRVDMNIVEELISREL